VTHDRTVSPSPHAPRNRHQFLEREASAAPGGFVHQTITAPCATRQVFPEQRGRLTPGGPVLGVADFSSNWITYRLAARGLANLNLTRAISSL
jgi:hypothetical protein